MALKLAVDTSAYRAFTDGHVGVVSGFREANSLAFPAVVLGELRGGFLAGTRTIQNNQVLDQILAGRRVQIHEVTEHSSLIYARLWAQARKSGRPIPTNDIWIAATCIERGYELLTLDRHFRGLPDLNVFELKS